ncbi:MAG: hypothetical protein IJN45_00145 [Alistipes sp.]|nr:hypothetical protein [Alistipes sp.]
MKKLLIFAAMVLMAGGAMAQDAQEGKTLYILDGQVVPELVFKGIPAEAIKNMNVVKGVESVVIASTVDTQRMVGVLTGKMTEVETMVLEGANNSKTEVSILSFKNGAGRDETHFRVLETDGAKPVTLVTDADGKTTQVKDILDVKPETIESMTVLKSEQAKMIYGDEYGDLKDGVILINLKKKEQTEQAEQTAKE